MKYREPLKKILMLVCFSVAGIAVVYYFGLAYLWKTNRNVANLEHNLDMQNRQQQYLSATEVMITSNDSRIARVNESVISKDGDVAFIDMLESKAKARGLSIVIDSLSLDDTPSLTSSNLTMFRVKAHTQGGWTGSYAFLGDIESLGFTLQVNSFAISTQSEDEKDIAKGVWNGLVDISVLKYK